MPRYYRRSGDQRYASGYMLWPLLVGLMVPASAPALVIARTGKYKMLMGGSDAHHDRGHLLMTQLTALPATTTLDLAVCPGSRYRRHVGIHPGGTESSRRPSSGRDQHLTFAGRWVAPSLAIAAPRSLSLISNLPKDLAKNGVPASFASTLSQLQSSSLGRATSAPNWRRCSAPRPTPTSRTSSQPCTALAQASPFVLDRPGSGDPGVVATLCLKELPLRTTTRPAADSPPSQGATEPAQESWFWRPDQAKDDCHHRPRPGHRRESCCP